MMHFLMSNWQILALLAVVFSAGSGFSSSEADVDEELEWAAHPMNKEGMNYVGD